MRKRVNTPMIVIKAQQGFTLVELITVVILLGIVSISIAPRFTGSTGFSEFAFQKRALSALRNIQLKSMYDTRPNFCYKFILDTDASPEFGPNTASFLAGQESASCVDTIDFSSDGYLRTDSGEMAAESLSLNALDGVLPISFLQFDSLGQPSSSAGSCSAGCTISFIGEQSANVCIASEGYIYAC